MRGLIRVRRAPQRALIGVVRAYRFALSPWVGRSCRFTPTCSAYALEALERHGALAGSALAGWRLLRCHPLCHGGCDPVPDNPPWKRGRRVPTSGSSTAPFADPRRRDLAPADADPPFSKFLP
jgi:putative membrane protein insertion efficiency factor